jgi:Putative MetA-pathway of phenol degradation
MRITVITCLTGCLLAGIAHAGDDDRIDPDRPDFVDSSKVVGKGRVQLEGGYAVERNRDDGVRERTGSTPVLLRLGVSDTLEARIETEGRMRYRADDADEHERIHERIRGWDDTTVGVKWRLAEGDPDGGWRRPALGLIADASFDTGSAFFRGQGVRPGLRAVAEWELPHGMSLGVMPGLVRDHDDEGRRAVNGVFAVSLGKDWSDRLHTFVEVAAPRIARARHGGTEASFDIGGAWALTKDCQIDAALQRGLNHRTADLMWTVGLSIRR